MVVAQSPVTARDAEWGNGMTIGLVLGGGAPNLTLMSGALLALDEAGIEFKVVTTTGAGMVVGLLWGAPKLRPGMDWKATRQAALRETRDWGIEDSIYDDVPINYQIFQKPGFFAEMWSAQSNPFLWSIPRNSKRRRLLSDGLALASTFMSPSNMRPAGEGLCQPPPWIDLIVDFDRLSENMHGSDTEFRLTAYCIEDETEATFDEDEITVDHFKAALAMPFIYSPYKVAGKTYLEGSAFKTLDLDPGNVMAEEDVDTIIFMDLMGNRNLIAEPRWLLDAWGKSIIAPLSRLAEQDVKLFKLKRDLHKIGRSLEHIGHHLEHPDELDTARAELVDLVAEMKAIAFYDDHHDPKRPPQEHMKRTELLRMPFQKTAEEMGLGDRIWKTALDWSWKNMSDLYDLGYETGKRFVDDHGPRLTASMKHTAERPGDAA